MLWIIQPNGKIPTSLTPKPPDIIDVGVCINLVAQSRPLVLENLLDPEFYEKTVHPRSSIELKRNHS